MTAYKNFDHWWNEQEGFASRSERAIEELGPSAGKWLKTAWELGEVMNGSRLPALEAENKRLRKALEKALDGLNDWIAIHVGEDDCGEEAVKAAQKRISEAPGTIGYISGITSLGYAALKSEGEE